MFFRLQEPPRALQEAKKSPPAGITPLSCNPKPFYTDFDVQKGSPEPDKSTIFVRHPQSFVILPLTAQVASGTRCWPGLRFGSLLALKMAESALGNPLGAAKSRSGAFFSAPRAPQETSKVPHKLLEAPPSPTKPFERLQEASRRTAGPIWQP